MNYITVYVTRHYLNEDGTYSEQAPYSKIGGSIATDLTPTQYRQQFEDDGVGTTASWPWFEFPKDDYINLDEGYELERHGNAPFYYYYPSDEADSTSFKPRVIHPAIEWANSNNRLIFHIWAHKIDDDLVKFGTLKSMFGVYKQHSDAVLAETLANLPSGGVDAPAVDAAIDAKLSTYTTERNEYVAQEIGDATSGLATTASVTDAVGAAKTELRGEMPKAYDYVNNPSYANAGYLTIKNIAEDDYYTNYVSNANTIPVVMTRASAGAPTNGLLRVLKSDVNTLIDMAVEAKMAEVREAVNGVLLFEELSAQTADVELPDVDVTAYERFAVTLRCEATTGSAARRSVQSVDVYAADLNALNTSSFAAVCKPVVLLMNKGLFDKYMVSNAICRFCDNAARTGLYVVGTWAYDANVILYPASGVTQGDESMGDVIVSVERIVGYKKLPEVS